VTALELLEDPLAHPLSRAYTLEVRAAAERMRQWRFQRLRGNAGRVAAAQGRHLPGGPPDQPLVELRERGQVTAAEEGILTRLAYALSLELGGEE
jgi:hypothetical protein